MIGTQIHSFNMRKLITLVIVSLLFMSCNPMLHLNGMGMRHHNLSQNKYQPGKHRKQVRVGSSPNSLFWMIKRRF
jgi:hypothetical protein